MTKRPSFTALKAFEALVRCGSISKAAQDIHVSQGAISQQVRRLEADLQTTLFDRNGRSMQPSAAAKEFAGDISGAFGRIDQAVDRIFKSTNTVQLRIATLPSVATRIVLPRLDEFRARLPKVQLSFSYIHQIKDSKNWEADVLICALDTEYTGEGQAQKLFSGAVQPFASKSYLTANGPFVDLCDASKAKLLHDFDTSAWRSWFEISDLDVSATNDGDVFEDFEFLVHAALADQGIALCPPALISKELNSGALLSVFENTVLQKRNYVVVLPEQAKKEAVIFADWMVEISVSI